MAYDEHLAERIGQSLKSHKVSFEAKKMMGGLCYLVDGKMTVGIVKNQLMARIDPDIYQEALQRKGAKEMDFTGRPMKGYVFVSPEGVDLDDDLDYWIRLAIEFNPKAKASKKKEPKKPPPLSN
ncbi:MAG: TfoX/Sxy family protein [Imperialibacter sp.]|uniref:TfoX/Sxy family protein n=1 Tax=Imperialibacter sp. TaxID=2038411 RepID=UPI003A89A6BF